MPAPDQQARAFDALVGSWDVENRMLRERLAHSTDWIAFPACSTVERVLGGLGNVERFEAELGGAPLLGLTVRLYDPVADIWSLRWADNRSPANGRAGMEPAFLGTFDDGGVGIFRATLAVDGRLVHARFTWSGLGGAEPAWEQAWATSRDGPWETNWTMAFRRTRR